MKTPYEKLVKSVAKSIERELGYTNGWSIADEKYMNLCERVAKRIIKRVSKSKIFDPS